MKMIQKTVLSALIASTFFAVPAFAGAFEGFNVQLGSGFSDLQSKLSIGSNTSINAGQSSVYGVMAAGYTYDIAETKYNIGANLFYLFTSKSIVGMEQSGSSTSVDVKNTWGFSIEPGYYVAADCLVYGKIGYARTSSVYATNGGTITDFGSSGGVVYGFGTKHFVTDNVFVGLESYRISFLDKKGSGAYTGFSNKLTYTQAGINVGYRF